MHVRLCFQGVSRVVGLAVDTHSGLLLWSDIDPEYRGIYKATVHGEDVRRIVQGTYTSICNTQCQFYILGCRTKFFLWTTVSDLHSSILDALSSIFFIFTQFSGNFGQIIGWCLHPLGLAYPTGKSWLHPWTMTKLVRNLLDDFTSGTIADFRMFDNNCTVVDFLPVAQGSHRVQCGWKLKTNGWYVLFNFEHKTLRNQNRHKWWSKFVFIVLSYFSPLLATSVCS